MVNGSFSLRLLEPMAKKIIAAIIRPSIEYGAGVWSPHLKKMTNWK